MSGPVRGRDRIPDQHIPRKGLPKVAVKVGAQEGEMKWGSRSVTSRCERWLVAGMRMPSICPIRGSPGSGGVDHVFGGNRTLFGQQRPGPCQPVDLQPGDFPVFVNDSAQTDCEASERQTGEERVGRPVGRAEHTAKIDL